MAAQPPVIIQEYVFMWAFLFSFIGAVFYGLGTLINVEPITIIANKNVAIAFNAIVGISGIISLFVWFNMDVPALDRAVLNQKVVKSNIDA
jgi:hypothetical protein